jgi:hypothetical protein
MVKKTWKMELKEKVEKMESELKEWEAIYRVHIGTHLKQVLKRTKRLGLRF